MKNRKRGKKKIENEKRDHQKNHFHACCSKGKQEEEKKRLRVREKEKEGEREIHNWDFVALLQL
jgi:hypothetical protein